MLRSHTCGDLRAEHIGTTVTLCGWVDSIRVHANVTFIMLRDRYGITQVVIDEEKFDISDLNRESVWKISGTVTERPEGTLNPNLDTGTIELVAESCEMLGVCASLPIEPRTSHTVSDEVRMKYRYLDLRSAYMLKNLKARHDVVRSIRNTLDNNDFLEVETPMFVKSTPEGSRDFVVPSRTHENRFYALPQSPQLYKQMLMVGGVDRYYSFPRCFRDEDARRGRQLVHTQIDFEMSFATEEDIYTIVEEFLANAWTDVLGEELPTPFPRYTYDEVIDRWGIDKPDLRFDLELVDVTPEVWGMEHPILNGILEAGGVSKAIVAPGLASYSRKQVGELEDFVKTYGVGGMSWIKVNEDGPSSNLGKNTPVESIQAIIDKTEAKTGDLIVVLCDKRMRVARALGELRNELAQRLDMIPEGIYRPLWVTDFPVFEFDENTGKWGAMHHMFTMPREEHLSFLTDKPADVRGVLYDVVLNGVELGSGSIRVTDPDLQTKIMDFVGYPREKAEANFGFFLEAYRHGAPQHAGMALGLDNLVMTMLGLTNLQDVIAFPNNSSGVFPLDDSPSQIEEEQWVELNLRPRKAAVKRQKSSESE